MDLAAQLDAHFAASVSPLVEHGSHGVAEERDGVLVTAVGRGGPAFNTAFVTRPSDAVGWACERLAAVGRPYTVQVPADVRPAVEEDLLARGLACVETLPGMVREATTEVPPLPTGLRLERVLEEGALAAHATALARGFGAPDPEAAIEVFVPALLHDTRVQMFNGHVDGVREPVATAVSVVVHGLAGVFGVTVAESVRRRGIGAALTWAAVSAGAQAGCGLVALQATELGRPVYAAMGFRAVRLYERWAPTRGRAGL